MICALVNTTIVDNVIVIHVLHFVECNIIFIAQLKMLLREAKPSLNFQQIWNILKISENF